MPNVRSCQPINMLLVSVVCLTSRPGFADPPDELLSKKGLYEQHALTHEGNLERGRQIFLDDKRTRCSACHVVQEAGGCVGPDLSAIGGKFDRPHLIESLLEPSRQIVEGYRATIITTTDGRTETGLVTRQSADRLALVDGEGRERIVATHDIQERRASPVSLMPDGLAATLTPAEFTDLVAFLESLRPGGNLTPGEASSGAVRLPAGFEISIIATRLTGSTALECSRDGRILICEQSGTLRVVKNGKLLDEPFVEVPVDSTWERGLIGVTVDPDFPETPYVYVCYVAREPYPHHRISRFTADGDRAVPGSERVLLEGDDQRKLGGTVPAGHQGGGLHFGPDGKLYIGIGEQTAETPAQSIHSLQGKMLRLNPDGTIPPDNPFCGEAQGKYRAIWARGLRNPFTFAIGESAGKMLMLINDVGGKFEEIDRGRAGANYGWPVVDHGPTDASGVDSPVHWYPQASISGGDFAPANFPWPDEFRGEYFFADFVHGWIKTLDPGSQNVKPFLSGLRRPVDLRFAVDGSLYVLQRNAWVIDEKFAPNTGTLLAIRYHWEAGDAGN
jgi:putative heme-binding domain-containing protein